MVKKTLVGYVDRNWKLKKLGLGIYHTMIWTKPGPVDKYSGKKKRLRITMEEI